MLRILVSPRGSTDKAIHGFNPALERDFLAAGGVAARRADSLLLLRDSEDAMPDPATSIAETLLADT